jgi:hypothetical protein
MARTRRIRRGRTEGLRLLRESLMGSDAVLDAEDGSRGSEDGGRSMRTTPSS